MIETPEVALSCVHGTIGDGSRSLFDLACDVLSKLKGDSSFDSREIGGVIAATFSHENRFPSLAVRVAAELGLPNETPAFDLQMACSAYPYAVYLASKLASDTGRKILVLHGDVQLRLVDRADAATGKIFSDAMTASLVSSITDSSRRSYFGFLSHADDALTCTAEGPIRMDGMKVFTFVATEVRSYLKTFLSNLPNAEAVDLFLPHQANPYMVRQLAKSLEMTDRLVTLDERILNPGGASIPLTIAEGGLLRSHRGQRALIAGFGAGYSASVGLVTLL